MCWCHNVAVCMLTLALVGNALAATVPESLSTENGPFLGGLLDVEGMVSRVVERFGGERSEMASVMAEVVRALHRWSVESEALNPDWINDGLAGGSTIGDGLIRKVLHAAGLDESWLGRLSTDVVLYLLDLSVRRNLLHRPTEQDGGNDIAQYRSIVKQEGFLPGLAALVRDARPRAAAVKSALSDRSLPGELVSAAAELGQERGADSDCVQLFLCRMSPVIWNVQDTVSARPMDYSRGISYNLDKWSNAIFHPEDDDAENAHPMPAVGDLVQFGRKSCDQRFPRCKLVDFAGLGLMGGEH